MQKLTPERKQFACDAIKIIMGDREYSDGAVRLRNFIRINYHVQYALCTCREIWREYLRREP